MPSLSTDDFSTDGFATDDVNVHAPYYVHRQEKAREVLKQAEEQGDVLIWAGPFSGKTSFVHSIIREAKADYGDEIYPISARKFNGDFPSKIGDLISQGSKQNDPGKKSITAEDFDKLVSFNPDERNCLFIIDDAQVSSISPAFMRCPGIL